MYFYCYYMFRGASYHKKLLKDLKITINREKTLTIILFVIFTNEMNYYNTFYIDIYYLMIFFSISFFF